MSIDRYYTLVDGNWVEVSFSAFWVDICHGIDERYYFPDLDSAIAFYLEGWKKRQFVNPDGSGKGLDNIGLYSGGRLIEGENLRRILGEYTRGRKLDEY